jgi:hypothetical protein
LTRRVDATSAARYDGEMGDTDPPPPDATSDESYPPPSPHARDSRRKRLVEAVIPEIIKRAVEIGVEKARESPDNLKQFVHDMKLPKEIAAYLLQQIDETKNGLFRVVAKEIRDFLEHTNFAGEIQKILTTVQFEVNTTIRFTPNDGRHERKAADDEEPPSSTDDVGAGSGPTSSLPKPEVKTQVHVRRDRDRDRARRRRARNP